MNKIKRIISVLLVLIFLANVLFSYQFIIDNAHHDCSGEECPICIQIAETVEFLSSIKFVPILSFMSAVVCAIAQLYKPVRNMAAVKYTLVSLKVELLN